MSGNEINIELIDAKDVPAVPKKTKWDGIFSNIPRSKALVLRDKSPSTVRTALKRYRSGGKGKDLYFTARKSEGGKFVCYVVNSPKETK